VLGYMLRARIEAIGKAVQDAAKQIEASERALEMLGAYSYEMDDAPSVSAPARG
jgi:hypothetical protein